MAILVRSAVASDYPAISRVAFDLHEHHVQALPHVFQSHPHPLPYQDFERLVASDAGDVFVAEEDGQIVGFATVVFRIVGGDLLTTRSLAFIDRFGVLTECRRSGVGRLLFQSCAAWGKAKGAQSLELDYWVENLEAGKFYTAMGMKPTRSWVRLDL